MDIMSASIAISQGLDEPSLKDCFGIVYEGATGSGRNPHRRDHLCRSSVFFLTDQKQAFRPLAFTRRSRSTRQWGCPYVVPFSCYLLFRPVHYC
jgi:hypothetical protein